MAKKKEEKAVVVQPLNLQTATYDMVGIAPLVINKFSARGQAAMREKQEQGDQANKGKKRSAKDSAATTRRPKGFPPQAGAAFMPAHSGLHSSALAEWLGSL